mmetsp:Transcript_18196/g.53025  ORF Transcript_18196/g.53025 Transcript_18196/m.53025 type:complete len:153 (+) Transcript_18196:883-1341(+)
MSCHRISKAIPPRVTLVYSRGAAKHEKSRVDSDHAVDFALPAHVCQLVIGLPQSSDTHEAMRPKRGKDDLLKAAMDVEGGRYSPRRSTLYVWFILALCIAATFFTHSLFHDLHFARRRRSRSPCFEGVISFASPTTTSEILWTAHIVIQSAN